MAPSWLTGRFGSETSIVKGEGKCPGPRCVLGPDGLKGAVLGQVGGLVPLPGPTSRKHSSSLIQAQAGVGVGTTPGGQSQRWPEVAGAFPLSLTLAELGSSWAPVSLSRGRSAGIHGCPLPCARSGKGWSPGPGSTDLLCGLGQVPFPFGRRLPVSGSEGPGGPEGPLSPARDCTFWFQKLGAERDALQRELEELKKKFEGLRSRNKVLSSEVKTLRSQMGTLVEKGRHDDELIDALMVRPPPDTCDPAPAPAPASPHSPPNATCMTQQPIASRCSPQGQEQLRSCPRARCLRRTSGTSHQARGRQRRKKWVRAEE